MYDDPRSAGSDPSDLTQRHTIDPNAWSAPEPIDPLAPVEPVAPVESASPVDPLYGAALPSDSGLAGGVDPAAGPDPSTDHYVPASEPRTEWTRSWNEAAPVTPERWYEPAPAPVPTMPAETGRGNRRGGAGSIVGAALLSAVLASGGTVLALGAAGVLDRTAATAPVVVPGTTNVGVLQPVSIDESSATIAVAAMVSPAVVRITVTGTSKAGDLGVIPATGVGSGVIFDSNGWILTNHHVVQGGEKFDVELKDGRVLQGKVYGIDTLTDLAIVKVEETGLPTAAIGESDALKVGQLVVAIGSPLGTYSNSVTSGIVSAKGRSITTDGNQSLTNLIQTDAAINPGNSGGPLLDASGNVIGINTAIATNSNGIGFAIPIDIARPIMAQAIAGEQLSRPYLGIRYVSITRQLADQQNLPVMIGALVGGFDGNGQPVSGIESGTPADKGGVKDGDIIVSINDKIIDADHPLDATLAQFSPDDVVSVVVLRDGKTETLQVTLGTRPSGL